MTEQEHSSEEEPRVRPTVPPGVYRVDEKGKVAQAKDWQKFLESIDFQHIKDLMDAYLTRGSSERKIKLVGAQILTAITLVAATYLACLKIIEGQAIVGFLGAAIGYLISQGKNSEER